MSQDWIYYLIYLIAFGASASAFSFKSLVWLRIFSAISSLAYVVYYFLFPTEPLWLDIVTEGSLIFINLYMLFWVEIKKKSMKLEEAEKEIHAAYFSRLSEFQFFKLIRIAHWHDIKHGKNLINKGTEVDALYFLYSGEARVNPNQNREIVLKDGAFLGELSFSLNQKATADVEVTLDSKILVWKQKELHQLLKRSPAMRQSFTTIITHDIAKKLN